MRGDKKALLSMSSCRFGSGQFPSGSSNPSENVPDGGYGKDPTSNSESWSNRWYLSNATNGERLSNNKHNGKTSSHSDFSNSAGHFPSGRRPVRRSSYKHVPHKEKPPHLVVRRNARERRRVQAVNNAFVRLRRHIPYENKNKRLSKVKTLQIAIDYIKNLAQMIEDHDRKNTAIYSGQRNCASGDLCGGRDHRRTPAHGPTGSDPSKENSMQWIQLNYSVDPRQATEQHYILDSFFGSA